MKGILGNLLRYLNLFCFPFWNLLTYIICLGTLQVYLFVKPISLSHGNHLPIALDNVS